VFCDVQGQVAKSTHAGLPWLLNNLALVYLGQGAPRALELARPGGYAWRR